MEDILLIRRKSRAGVNVDTPSREERANKHSAERAFHVDVDVHILIRGQMSRHIA